MSAANPAPARNEPAPAPAAAAPASSGAAKAGSYVPPHLRKNQ